MPLNSFLSFAGALLASGLAVVVVFRDTRSFVHWTFAVGMIVLALERALTGMSAQAVLPAEVVRWQRLGLVAAALLPGSWLLFSLSFARANYQELLTRWKWFTCSAIALPLALVTVFRQSLFAMPPSMDEFSASLIPLGWSGHLFYLFFLCMSAMILMNLEGTLRASAGRKRWRIKFMVLGVGSLFGVRIYTVSQSVLFSSVNLELESVNSYALVVAGVLIILSFVRSRLLDVDIYLSQAFLYNSIMVLAVGIYLLAVGVLAKALGYLGGGQLLPLSAVFVFLALVGLTTVLLSDQVRQQSKRFVSRNFHRPQHDYRKEWTTFTHQTTSLVDIKDLCAAVAKIVSETFGVPFVTIWLLDERQEHLVLGGSTAFSEAQARGLQTVRKGALDLLRAMQDQQRPIDFERPPDARTKGLRRSSMDFLREARLRYCVALVAGREFLGVITLDERLTREPLSVEDFDLLKTIADQAAGSLLNLKLSERLLRAKAMEAFQTLSAFLMHDLKNLASTLSLTLQNLPVHYDNPAFRDDTLRVIAQGVGKMNDICSRLSPLSQRLELQPTEVGLNELVTATLAGLNSRLKASVIEDLHPVPRLVIDPEQMQKVLINLIVNANEAVGDAGEIRVATRPWDGGVVLAVSDNGCGMSRAFMERSLFHPFHTTKRQGLGIGLFHSKMIIEAHRGKIEVESQEGKGSRFSVMLPGF